LDILQIHIWGTELTHHLFINSFLCAQGLPDVTTITFMHMSENHGALVYKSPIGCLESFWKVQRKIVLKFSQVVSGNSLSMLCYNDTMTGGSSEVPKCLNFFFSVLGGREFNQEPHAC
jgi:hypothetical protein